MIITPQLISLCKAFADGDESVREPLHDLFIECGLSSECALYHLLGFEDTRPCYAGSDASSPPRPHCSLVIKVMCGDTEALERDSEYWINFKGRKDVHKVNHWGSMG